MRKKPIKSGDNTIKRNIFDKLFYQYGSKLGLSPQLMHRNEFTKKKFKFILKSQLNSLI